MVISFGLVSTTSGQSRLFQLHTNVKMATAETTGRLSGMITRQYVRKKPAPSTRAASSRSRGMPSKNCLKMNTAMAAGICGRITAQYVLSRCMPAISLNCGTTSTCCGIMIPTRMNQNTSHRNRNRIRDSAKAAMLATSTVAAAVTVEVMKLDAYQFQMSPCANSVRNDASVGLSMAQVGLVVSALGLSAVSMVQAIGTSQRRANAMSTPAQTPLNSLIRRSMLCWVTEGAALRCGRVSATVVMVRSPVPGGG